MSEIYASDVHYSVNGAKDILLKIKNFAQAQGWTVVSYLTNVQWLSDGDGTYSWQSGTEDFLELLSNGYGSQALRYRFYTMFELDKDFESFSLPVRQMLQGLGKCTL